MTDTVVIEGEVSLVNQIDGDPDVFIGGGGSQPTGTKSILLTEAGTKTEDVADYAYAEINAVKSATASGAVASFSDGAEDVPMTTCVVNIEPVQDLHGQDAPYPPGGGKNLIDSSFCVDRTQNGIKTVRNNDGSITITGTASSSLRFWNSNDTLNLTLKPGTYTLSPNLRLTKTGGYDINTFTLTEETTYKNIVFLLTNGQTYNETFYPQLETGSTATAYAPYSNICPISGWSEVNVARTGKNLFGGTYLSYFALPLPQGTVATVSCSTETGAPRMGYYDADKNLLDYWTLTSTTDDGTRRYKTFTLNADTAYFRMSGYNAKEVQIELGSVPTSYEPFGETYTTDLGQTVYGGTLDVVTGVLTVTDGYIASYAGETLPSTWISDRDVYVQGTTPTTGAQVVYKLATPTTVQLSPTEVKTLLGSNSVWADSGDISVGYKADVYLTEGGITPTGTKQINIASNGTMTEDVTDYASAEINVNVPNSYSASDEGKVVSNGALVAQTSDTVTANDTYDTTLINSLTVNVSGGGISIDDIAGGEPTGAITITASTIEQYAFMNKKGLTSVSAPNCTSIKNYAFSGCSGVTSMSFPEVNTLGTYVFSECSGITTIALPKLTSGTGTRGFASCTKLAVLDLGTCNSIDGQCFYSSGALRTLVLRKTSSITSLSNWNATVMGGIYNNPTASTVYVPQALISSYQSASNWSAAYSAGVTFAKIEGSIYE